VSSLFYLGADAHVCRNCGARFELADPVHDRRSGDERRALEDHSWAEWRSGEDRRRATTLDPRARLRTPSAA
jgi:hypothetical protein